MRYEVQRERETGWVYHIQPGTRPIRPCSSSTDYTATTWVHTPCYWRISSETRNTSISLHNTATYPF